MTIGDFELREIYRKYAVRRLSISSEDPFAEDLAQEMYLQALNAERRKGISRFNCTVKWLFCDAYKKMKSQSKITNSYDEYLYPDTTISELDFMNWISSNWLDYSNLNGGRGKILKKYKLTCNDVFITLSGSEIRDLLDKKNVLLSDSNIVSNLRKKGKTHFLVNDCYFKTLQSACNYFKVCLTTLHKKYTIRKLKLCVV